MNKGCYNCRNKFLFSDDEPCSECFRSWWMEKEPKFWEAADIIHQPLSGLIEKNEEHDG